MSSVSQIVKEAVLSDPCMLQCILNDVVNYTKLSRRLSPIISEMLGRNVPVDTVKMALIRFADRVLKEFAVARQDIVKVLARSSIEIRTGITIVTLRNAAFARVSSIVPLLVQRARFIAVMQSLLVTTMVLDSETAEEVLSRLSRDEIVQVQKDYAAIVIVSPIEIMYTPGVLSYITNVLALNNVNIVHIESCYTDTILIVSKDDLLKAFQALSRYIEVSKKIVEGSSQASS